MIVKNCVSVSGLVILALAAARCAHPEQFLWFEHVHHCTKNVAAEPKTGLRTASGVPEDWLEPVNYYRGTVHYEIEILSQPSDAYILHQVGVFQDRIAPGKESWGRLIKSTGPGVYRAKDSPRSWWHSHTIDWSKKKIGPVTLFKTGPTTFVEHDDASRWPLKVRYRVYVVSEGGTFNPHGSYGGLHYQELTELRKAAACLERGFLGPALTAAQKELDSNDPKRAGEARRVVEALEKYAETRRSELAQTKAAEPIYAVEALVRLAEEFRPSERFKALAAEARSWNGEKATVEERQARRVFEAVKKAGDNLRRKMRGRKASDPEMARKHRRDISLVAQYVSLLRKKWPETPSCRRAVQMAEELGVPLPD